MLPLLETLTARLAKGCACPRACFSRFTQVQRVVDNTILALSDALPEQTTAIRNFTAMLSAMIDSPVKLGFDRTRARDLNWLFTDEHIAFHGQRHVQDQYFEFLEHLGIDPHPAVWNVRISDEEIEEAWLETRTLPLGLTARVGRFASQIGYLNQQHPHADDFVGAVAVTSVGSHSWTSPPVRSQLDVASGVVGALLASIRMPARRPFFTLGLGKMIRAPGSSTTQRVPARSSASR